ncbi:MAG: penicillin-binding protein, partial [bacterium]|nr:penicillin-binding protein [bacterium]
MLFNNPWKKRVVTVLAAVLAVRLFLLLLPYPELSKFNKSPYALPVLDREGTELFTIPLNDGLKRYRLEEANLPKYLKRIIIKSEDRWFYFHFGINPVSVVRTSIINYREKRIVSGASTITMQLARMVTPRNKGM